MRVAITGAYGLLGWHIRCHFFASGLTDLVSIGRAEFNNPAELPGVLEGCDAVIHCAGMNRGADTELVKTNTALAGQLVAALEQLGSAPQVIYTSTIHVDRDTPYGRSKAQAGKRLGDWADRAGAKYVELVLPHVFGELGRPFYNSVVHTFCHQIARQETARVDQDSDLELLHAQDVAAGMLQHIRAGDGGSFRPSGHPIRVSELLDRLLELDSRYRSGLVPDLADAFQRRLFNTYRSYLYPDFYPVEFDLHTDQRGYLFESIKSLGGGQCFLSGSGPGIVRGNHFHLGKFERFVVVRGQGRVRVRKLFDTAVREFALDGARPACIDIPTLHTHSLENTGSDELLALFWADEIFDPEHPDTCAEPVLREQSWVN
jgi:UDP-2-acetamido-2,6-beta-L-arabino-hexul-4-ose reductase